MDSGIFVVYYSIFLIFKDNSDIDSGESVVLRHLMAFVVNMVEILSYIVDELSQSVENLSFLGGKSVVFYKLKSAYLLALKPLSYTYYTLITIH